MVAVRQKTGYLVEGFQRLGIGRVTQIEYADCLRGTSAAGESCRCLFRGLRDGHIGTNDLQVSGGGLRLFRGPFQQARVLRLTHVDDHEALLGGLLNVEVLLRVFLLKQHFASRRLRQRQVGDYCGRDVGWLWYRRLTCAGKWDKQKQKG